MAQIQHSAQKYWELLPVTENNKLVVDSIHFFSRSLKGSLFKVKISVVQSRTWRYFSGRIWSSLQLYLSENWHQMNFTCIHFFYDIIYITHSNWFAFTVLSVAFWASPLTDLRFFFISLQSLPSISRTGNHIFGLTSTMYESVVLISRTGESSQLPLLKVCKTIVV